MLISKDDYIWLEDGLCPPTIKFHIDNATFLVDTLGRYELDNEGNLALELPVVLPVVENFISCLPCDPMIYDDPESRFLHVELPLASFNNVLDTNGELKIRDPLHPENGGYLEVFKACRCHNGKADDWSPRFDVNIAKPYMSITPTDINKDNNHYKAAFDKLENWLNHLNVELILNDSERHERYPSPYFHSHSEFGVSPKSDNQKHYVSFPTMDMFKSENDFLRAGAIVCAQFTINKVFHGSKDKDLKFINKLEVVKHNSFPRNIKGKTIDSRAHNLVMASSAMMITAQLGVTLDKTDLAHFSNWDRKLVFDTTENRDNLKSIIKDSVDSYLYQSRLIKEEDYNSLIELSSRIPAYLKNLDVDKNIASSKNEASLWEKFCESRSNNQIQDRSITSNDDSFRAKLNDLAKAITAKKSSAALDTPSSKAAKCVTMER